MLIITIIFIIIVAYLYYCEKDKQEKAHIKAIELENQRKIEEIQRQEEEEKHKQKIIILKQKWIESDLFQIILNQIYKFIDIHKKEIEGKYISKNNTDILCLVISETQITIYHYLGLAGKGLDDNWINNDSTNRSFGFDGKYYEWHYDENALNTIHKFVFCELGYEDLDSDMRIALSDALNDTLKNNLQNEWNIRNDYGFIIVDFNNFYKKLNSIFQSQ